MPAHPHAASTWLAASAFQCNLQPTSWIDSFCYYFSLCQGITAIVQVRRYECVCKMDACCKCLLIQNDLRIEAHLNETKGCKTRLEKQSTFDKNWEVNKKMNCTIHLQPLYPDKCDKVENDTVHAFAAVSIRPPIKVNIFPSAVIRMWKPHLFLQICDKIVFCWGICWNNALTAMRCFCFKISYPYCSFNLNLPLFQKD